MSPLKVQTCFLLRGSALLIGLLSVWWLALQEPMLFLLRNSVREIGGLVFGISSAKFVAEAPNGDWTFEVPIEFTAAAASGSRGALHCHSINFDFARSDVSAFTFGLPAYWAIILAVPGIRRSMRALAQGTLLMALAEIVLLLMFVEVFAHKTAASMSLSQSAVRNWFWHLGEYLMMGVIPYLVPFAAAIWLHGGLRGQIFGWTPAAPQTAVAAGGGALNARSRRGRR
jgi:hypothetical protein